MARRLATLAAALSLVLCAVTVALWVRSYSTRDEIHWAERGGRYHCLDSVRGRIVYTRDEPCPYTLRLSWAKSKMPGTQTEFAPGGREWIEPAYGRDGRLRAAGPWFSPSARRTEIPYAAAAICSGALPLGLAGSRAWSAQRARSLRRNGHCPTCGYDLRATPARCPECGAVPAAPAAR